MIYRMLLQKILIIYLLLITPGIFKDMGMKKGTIFFALLTCFFMVTMAQTKRALVVAIANYPPSSGWGELSSLNDIPLIKNTLLKQQFQSENIDIITEEAATRSGIENALNRLIEKAQPGDVVVIYFSSHGEQIEDDNQDEVDGLDECIVPFDATFSSDKSEYKKYAPAYFRDDYLGEKITRLRNKLTRKGDVLVGIDACHSGSGVRGVLKVRGNKAPMVSNSFEQGRARITDTSGVFSDKNSTRLNADAATYVVISAAQAQELSVECYDDESNVVGSLSYAFSKSLNSIEGKITYRNLFARIEDMMRGKVPNQSPVLEGDGIDRELFGGRYESQKPYFTINAKSSTAQSVLLNAGTVAGITTGSVVGFYPVGTTDPLNSNPIQKGTVITSNNFTAAVKPEQEDSALLKNPCWVFLLETVYGKNKIKLGLDSLKNGNDQMIRDGLSGFQLVEFSPDCDLYLAPSATGNGYALCYANSGVVFSDGLDIQGAEGIREVLKRFDRFRYLRNLNFTEEGLSAKVELVFLDQQGNIDAVTMKSRIKFGRLELKEDDVVFLRITNTGSKKFYINIVDIQPDGKINPILPNKQVTDINNAPAPITWQDCEIESKAERLFKNYSIRIAPPHGEETFKVFLSSNPLDLEDILTTNRQVGAVQATGVKGVMNNLAKIFEQAEVNEVGTRSGDGKINTAQNGTIFSLNFRILPK